MSGPVRDGRASDEARRRRAFWVTAACVIVALAVLITLRPGDSASSDETASTIASTTTSSTSTSTSTSTAPERPAPLPSGKPIKGTRGIPITLPPADARPAVERFLDSWVRYQNGLAPASTIESATSGCLADIRSSGPPSALAGREVQITGVRATRDGKGLLVNAVVDDGSRYGVYAVLFHFVERRAEWLCDARPESE